MTGLDYLSFGPQAIHDWVSHKVGHSWLDGPINGWASHEYYYATHEWTGPLMNGVFVVTGSEHMYVLHPLRP